MFRHTSFAQEIVFGAGTLAQLGEAVAGFGDLVYKSRQPWKVD